ncbi:MAG: AAA family ATPase [Xanthomonadales bacterium]|nr:AAA family ATPase [Xanthomonadales bacterium]
MNLLRRRESQEPNVFVDERMYLDHFELKEAPFSITPDPRFVFLTAQHRDAMAHLLFGITQGGGGGFVQLTGEVGTGKTTLCRLLIAQVPDTVRIALVLNPMQQPLELLRTICDELHILLPKRTSSIKALTDALTRYLLESYAAGLRVVLIIDEAQNLSFEALEQVRLLTNLETPTQKLLQIILLGQPELRTLLAGEHLRQLAQRITGRFHLAPLTASETAAYVEHRLAVAGRRRPLFAAEALRELFRQTRGFPRAVNVVADRALLGGFARGLETIDAPMVRLAAAEIRGESEPARPRWALYAGLAAAAALVLWVGLMLRPGLPAAPMAATVPPLPVAPAAATADALSEVHALADDAEAMDVVAGWWDSPGPRRGERCSAALPSGALCARLRLNEALLRELDRPVALALQLDEGRSWFALRRLEAKTAHVAGAQRMAQVPWDALARRWVGEAVLVVARPAQYDGAILGPGSDLGALPPSLFAFAGEVPAAGSQLRHDDAFAASVRTLQQRYGLIADGLIGPETMALLVALQRGGPLLAAGAGDGASVSNPQP